MFGSHRLYNGFTHIQMQIRCKTNPGCISTCPRLVLKGPGPENRVQGPGHHPKRKSDHVLLNYIHQMYVKYVRIWHTFDIHLMDVIKQHMVRFSFWVRFSKKRSPRRARKRTPLNDKIPKCLDLIDCTMVLPISKCKFDAKQIPDAFQHVPDLFWRARARKIGFRDPATKMLRDGKNKQKWQILTNLKLAPKNQLGLHLG